MELFCLNNIESIQSGYLKKEYSVVEVAHEMLKECKKYQEFDVWSCLDEEILLKRAKICQDKIEKNEIRALLGIPIGVKDIINTYDYTTEMGSPLWKGFEAGNDARVVAQLKGEGAFVAGKTVTAEFAVDALTATRNPFDKSKTPGTSSSGSAAAVALGLVPVALATQTAGSIIRPSSFCGVIGFKPSFGIVPRVGVLKTTDSLDTVGFMTTNVENIRKVFDNLIVKGIDYPFSYHAFHNKNRQKKGKRPWKLAFIKTYTWDNAKDYVKRDIEQWIRKINNEDGVEVVEEDINSMIHDAHEVHRTIYEKSLSYYFQNESLCKDEMSEGMLHMIGRGREIEASDYFHALERQDQLLADMDRFMEKYDAIISMSTASEAVQRGCRELDDPSLIWNLLHLPTVNIPAFKNQESQMPFGIQITARKYNDYLLLHLIEEFAQRHYIMQNIRDITYKPFDI
ncbi:amidase [Lachnospiraceae bacterium]|nr:amidase [Lachnospiraceae bacterium]